MQAVGNMEAGSHIKLSPSFYKLPSHTVSISAQLAFECQRCFQYRRAENDKFGIGLEWLRQLYFTCSVVCDEFVSLCSQIFSLNSFQKSQDFLFALFKSL